MSLLSGPPIPPKMRAWTYTRRGQPSEILELKDDLPTPQLSSLGPNDVLVKISHVALNFGVAVFMSILPHLTSKPWVPELEFSGTVIAVGSETARTFAGEKLRTGDEIFGAEIIDHHFRFGGVLAEYLVIPISMVLKKPEKVSFAEASGIAGVGCTAVQACEVAGLREGDRVFVNGGSGGVGTMVVQVAKTIVGNNGMVVATCSGANVELVKDLGADEVVDYTLHASLPEYLKDVFSNKKFDAIIDNVGASQELYTWCPAYLKPDGSFINLGGMGVTNAPSATLVAFLGWAWTNMIANRMWYLPKLLGGRNVGRKYRFFSAKPQMESASRVRDMVESGEIKGVVDSVWDMGDAFQAYLRVLSGRAKGKVVIKVADDTSAAHT